MGRRHQTKAKGPPKPQTLTTSVLSIPSIWEQGVRSFGKITPQVVQHAIASADLGIMAPLVDLFFECRQRWGDLHAMLETREIAIQSLPWELIVPGRDDDSTRGNAQLKFCEQTLAHHAGLPGLILHLAAAFGPGYAVGEIVWRKDGSKLVPASFILHHPRRFCRRPEDGKLVWQQYEGDPNGIDFREKWPVRFIVYEPRVTGDVPQREGLMRLLVWLTCFATWMLGDLMQFAELSWKTQRAAKYDANASKETIAGIRAALAAGTNKANLVYPDTVKELLITTPKGGNGNSGHLDGLRWLGQQAAKSILGNTLTSDVGDSGSRALGEVQERKELERRTASGSSVFSCLTEQLVQLMVTLNYGRPGGEDIAIRPTTDDTPDMKMLAEVATMLCKVMRVPTSWVYDQIGIPQPKEGDEILSPPKAEPDPDKPANDDQKEAA